MALIEAMRQLAGKSIVALVTLLIGFIIAKLAGRITRRVLSEAEINRILATEDMKLDKAISRIVEYVIYTITLLVILQQFGLTKLVLGIIITIAVIIIGFSALLAIKDFIPNAITGLFIKRKLKQNLGKKVKIGIVTGKLVHVGIMESVIQDKEEHHIPHLYASKENIIQVRAS
ncbi:MAG TPA: hypothetical protein VI612_00515 [Candidatus Nanoarchaeia archaeon]|nr:hypothetical protein [Candidatus Nanoarchaeia archaeon]